MGLNSNLAGRLAVWIKHLEFSREGFVPDKAYICHRLEYFSIMSVLRYGLFAF